MKRIRDSQPTIARKPTIVYNSDLSSYEREYKPEDDAEEQLVYVSRSLITNAGKIMQESRLLVGLSRNMMEVGDIAKCVDGARLHVYTVNHRAVWLPQPGRTEPFAGWGWTLFHNILSSVMHYPYLAPTAHRVITKEYRYVLVEKKETD